MSDVCAASSTDWRQQYDSVWHVDFEYREDANYHPVPVSMFAYEQHSGTEIFLRREQLLSPQTCPVRSWKSRSAGGLCGECRAVVFRGVRVAVSLQCA